MPKLEVRLHIENYSDDTGLIIEKRLIEVLKELDSQSRVKFFEAEQYWKIPELTE